MKTLLFAAAALCLQISPALSANISSAGVDGPDGGLLNADGDPYWWFCIQPDGSLGPVGAAGGSYEAPLVSIEYGWTRQTTERFTFAGTASPQAQADLALQVNVIEYVLDEWLPWKDTADRFLENVATPASSTDQTADVFFFNRFYAVQQYIKQLHGKLYEDNASFTDLSVYNPSHDFGGTAADAARINYFNNIVADVKAKDALGFFTSYTPAHDYAVVNTFTSQFAAPNYQDLILIGAAIPEPSAAVLGLGSLVLLGTRRRRA